MKFNFNIRVVIEGEDSDQVTEEDLTQFIKTALASGSYGIDNPLIDPDKDCDISYVEID